MSLRRYRAILRTPQVPRLVSASVLGRLPLGMVGLALVLPVRHAGGSFGPAGLTAGSFLLGTCLFAATPASRTWRPSGGRRDWGRRGVSGMIAAGCLFASLR